MTTSAQDKAAAKKLEDDAAADAPPPPKGPTPRTPRKSVADKTAEKLAAPKKPGRKPKDVGDHETRARRVAGLYDQIGKGLVMAGMAMKNGNLAAGGEAMTDTKDELGEAWATAADSSERVAKFIDGIATGGAFGALLLAHFAIAQAFMAGPAEGSVSSLLMSDGDGGIADILAAAMNAQ
jgi:hypothetical protein